MEKTMTTGEAAKHLNVTSQTIRKWVDNGIMKTFRTPTGRRLVLASEVDRLIKQGQENVNKQKQSEGSYS